MSSELIKRIFTSIILLIILFILNFSNLFLIGLFIVCGWICLEFSGIFEKIFKKKRYYWFFQFLSLFYIFLIFGPIATQLHGRIEFGGSGGPVFFLYILSICFFTDIGGYVVGKIFKGRKLTKISPNKTVSGTIGSFIFSTFPLVIFSQINIELYSLNYKNLIFCLLVSLVSQAGDLFVSFLKRKAKIKDTGKIVYGHGGLLDRMDGIIFAVPFVCIYLHGFEHINFFDYFFK